MIRLTWQRAAAWLVALGTLAVLPAPVRAQYGTYGMDGYGMNPYLMGIGVSPGERPAGAISGVGLAVVRKAPSILRMHVAIKAGGESAEAAIAELERRRKAAMDALVGLGASRDSLAYAGPVVSRQDVQRRQQLARMVRQRLQAGGKKSSKPPPEEIDVLGMVTAQWTLEPGDEESLLLMSHKLREQVKAAKLSTGGKEQAVSEEEQEMIDEMGGMYSSQSQQEVNEPLVFCVARITPEERDRARAEAYRKARDAARRTAEAAGLKLGPLETLTCGAWAGAEDENDISESYAYRPYRYQSEWNSLQELLGRDAAGAGSEGEGASSLVGDVAFQFTAQAAYRVAAPAASGAPAGGPGSLTAYGAGKIEKFPTAIALTMPIPGRGKNIQEALADLKARREAALVKLESLGAERKSLHAEPPRLAAGQESQRREIERMLRQRMGKRGVKTVKIPVTVVLSSRIRARWTVTSKTADELFLEAEKLREKVQQAGLAGSDRARKLSPEEEELAEELGVAAFSGQAAPDADAAALTFVAAVTASERREVLARALAQSKANAALAAESAGARLGTVLSVSDYSVEANSMRRYARAYPAYRMQMGGPFEDSVDEEERTGEALGSAPGNVELGARLAVTYALERTPEAK